MMKRTLSLVGAVSISAFGFACSSTPSGEDGGTDAQSPTDSATNDSAIKDSQATDVAAEAGPVNGCTAFTDDTTDGGVITGPSDFNPAQYTPNCVHVKVGQSVTWNVDLTDHPLAPAGGDTPNPINPIGTGTSVTYSFPNAGTFGFHCAQHPTLMFGAVEVTQ